MENKQQEFYTFDLVHISKALWKKAWLIILSGISTAIAAFLIAAFLITPTYSSSVMLYVNNTSFSLGNTNFSISSSEITAAQSLVRTYSEILSNRTTLERIIDKTDVPYDYIELKKMIEATPSHDTEIMKVTVTSNDPYEAAKIANGIADILPVRVSEIINGASMEVVDSAIPVLKKVAPSATLFTAVGFFLGVLLSSGIVIVLAIKDDVIHDEYHIQNNYSIPILAKVPDLNDSGINRYSYYRNREENQNSKGTTNHANPRQ